MELAILEVNIVRQALNDYAYIASTHVADQYAAIVWRSLLGPQVEAECNRIAAVAHGHAGLCAVIPCMDGACVAGTEFHLDVHGSRLARGCYMGRKLAGHRRRLLGGYL